MASKYMQGVFVPKNPAKIVGPAKTIHIRSSWEFACFQAFDSNPGVLYWASEAISIPYVNPLTNKTKSYIPDIFVIYVSNDVQHAEIIEIKPLKETPAAFGGFTGKVDNKTQLVQAVNTAKWLAAIAYCRARKWTFRILTEREIFAFKRKK